MTSEENMQAAIRQRLEAAGSCVVGYTEQDRETFFRLITALAGRLERSPLTVEQDILAVAHMLGAMLAFNGSDADAALREMAVGQAVAEASLREMEGGERAH
jgi:hypothetical protein